MGVGLLVTGTDTGIGKTYVAAALVRALVRSGRSVGVCKPLESGWPDHGDGTDAETLRIAAGGVQSLDEVCLHRFKTPVTPLVAAEIEGVVVDSAGITRHVREQMERFEITLVEGAGGLLAPLAPGWTALDLARDAGLAALVVVGDRLGCLNHALMTERILTGEGVPVAALVMNATPGTWDESVLSNRDVLRMWSSAPVIEDWRDESREGPAEWSEAALDALAAHLG